MNAIFWSVLALWFCPATYDNGIPEILDGRPSVVIDSKIRPDSKADRDAILKSGDVFIPRDRRPRNKNGNCVWAATEMCFWGASNIKEFEGIMDRAYKSGWHGAYMGNVRSYCKTVGQGAEFGNSVQFLKEAVQQGTGAVVFIPGHAIFLGGIDDESVRILDNNGPPEYQVWSRRKFDGLYQEACRPILPSKPNPNHPPVNPNPPVQPQVTPMPPPTPHIDTNVLLKELTDLKVQIAELKARKPEKGDKGDPGKDGRDGKDGAAADLAEIKKLWEAQLAVLEQVNTLKIDLASLKNRPTDPAVVIEVSRLREEVAELQRKFGALSGTLRVEVRPVSP